MSTLGWRSQFSGYTHHSLQNRKVICSWSFFRSSPELDAGDDIVIANWVAKRIYFFHSRSVKAESWRRKGANAKLSDSKMKADRGEAPNFEF